MQESGEKWINDNDIDIQRNHQQALLE